MCRSAPAPRATVSSSCLLAPARDGRRSSRRPRARGRPPRRSRYRRQSRRQCAATSISSEGSRTVLRTTSAQLCARRAACNGGLAATCEGAPAHDLRGQRAAAGWGCSATGSSSAGTAGCWRSSGKWTTTSSPPLALGSGSDGRVVCGGDRLHDGEPETEPAVVSGAIPTRALKGLEEPVDLRRHREPGRYCEPKYRVIAAGFGDDFDAAANNVVAQCVVDEVGHESLGERRGHPWLVQASSLADTRSPR